MTYDEAISILEDHMLEYRSDWQAMADQVEAIREPAERARVLEALAVSLQPAELPAEFADLLEREAVKPPLA